MKLSGVVCAQTDDATVIAVRPPKDNTIHLDAYHPFFFLPNFAVSGVPDIGTRVLFTPDQTMRETVSRI